MQKPAETHSIVRSLAEPRAVRDGVVVAFFLIFFLYVWVRLDPAVEYYSEATVFFLNGTFLHRFLDYPGGVVEYGAAFLAQLNYLGWLGALVFTALGALVFLAASWLFRQAASRAPVIVCLAPMLVLVAWRGRYEGHTLAASLALVLALLGAMTCPWVSRGSMWWRLPAGWMTGAALYYAAGLWPFLLFLFFSGWFEASQQLWQRASVLECGSPLPLSASPGAPQTHPPQSHTKAQKAVEDYRTPKPRGPSRRRDWLSVVGLVLPALLIPVAWPGLPLPTKVLNPWGMGLPLLFAGLAFLLLPAGLVALILLPGPHLFTDGPIAAGETPPPHLAPRQGQKKGARSRGSPHRPWRQVWRTPAFTIVSLLAGWVLVWGLFDGTRKSLAQIERCAALGQDKQLLAAAQQLETLPVSAEVRVHLALYHTGRLIEDLFAFANRGKGELLPGLELGLAACLPQGETLLELGQVNEAEHQAHEVLEFDGDRRDVLRLLAKINILKDRPKAAAVFLNLLCQVPFQRDWAATWLAELERDPRLTGDRLLALARSRMVTTDLPHDELPAETMLRQLLHSNPKNQMAFEYLIAYYLLAGDLKKLTEHLGQLDDFGYRTIPRHLEEALLLGQKLQGLQFDLHGRKIQPETIQRFQSFCEALDRSRGQALAPNYSDTYWYYYYSRLAQQPKS